MWMFVVDKHVTWDKLKLYGKNKFVLSTTIFLFLTPLLYKFKIFLEKSVSVFLDHELTIEIPFTWQLLFVASLFFSIGTLLFRLFCPDIVYKYSNLGDYQKAGNYITQLIYYINEIVKFEYLEQYIDGNEVKKNTYEGELPPNSKLKKEVENRKELQSVFHMYSAYFYLDGLQFRRVKDDLEKTQLKRIFLDSQFRNTFYEIFDYAKGSNKVYRLCVALCYFIGTVLVGINLMQNIIYVFNHLFI